MAEYGRRLPHFHPDDAYLFVTWRLRGSMPKVEARAYASPGHAFVAHDRALDRDCPGPRWLEETAIADLVAGFICAGEKEKRYYELEAWVVMPNHVHLLILPRVSVRLLINWLKGVTARRANQILGRTGHPFWQVESYDHYLRKSDQVGRTVAYIENNPVSAGLAGTADGWRWSSAGWPGNAAFRL